MAEPPAYLGHLANVGVGADLRMTVAGQVRPSMLRRSPGCSLAESRQSPPPTNAENQPLDSSACNLLICKSANYRPSGLRTPEGGAAGEKNGRERVEPGPERLATPFGEVRRLPQKPPTTRGNRRDRVRKNPNRERLGFG